MGMMTLVNRNALSVKELLISFSAIAETTRILWAKPNLFVDDAIALI